MQPNNPSDNNSNNSSVPGVAGNEPPTPQSREFQIPRGDDIPPIRPATTPSPTPRTPTPQPSVIPSSMQSRSVQNKPPQPARHETPIYMSDGGNPNNSASYPSANSGATSRPVSNQPLQKPIPAPVGVSASPPRPKQQSSMLKYAIFGIIALAIVFILVWLFIGLFSGNDSSETSTDNSQKKEVSTNTYQSDSMEFTVKYPDDWVKDETEDNGLETVKFSSPDVRSNGTAVAETAILMIPSDKMKTIKNQETFFNTYEKAVKSGFESFTETDSEIVTIDGFPTKRVEANVSSDGESDKAVFYFVYAEDNGYVIISYADQEVYDSYKPKLDVFISEFDSQLNN